MIFNVTGGGGVTIKNVWQNASPISNFSAQTVSVTIPANAMVMVFASWSTEDASNVICGFASVGERGRVYTQWNDRAGRLFTVSTTGVAFQSGMYGSKTDSLAANNAYIIPQAIYVIKGVQ